MSGEGSGRAPAGSGPAIPPEPMNAVLGRSARQDEAVQRLLQALDQVGREVEIAAMTLDGCEDLEGTAYHLRRALANLKFAGGVLVDLRKRKG